MPTVLISCIPRLNERQQQGVLLLLKDIEELGFKVLIWSDHKYDLLKKYDIEKIIFSDCNDRKLTRYWYYLKVLFFIEKKKWIERIKKWRSQYNISSESIELEGLLREAVRVFGIIKPEYFLCWNPWCCRFGVAYDVAKVLGLKAYGIEWGYLPDTFLIDKQGTLATSTFFRANPLKDFDAVKLNGYKERGQEIFSRLREQNLGIYNQNEVKIPEGFNSHEERIKVLLLSISEIDAGAYPVWHSDRKGLLPYHESSFLQAFDIANKDKSYQVIYKPHPSHNEFNKDDMPLPNLAIVNGDPEKLIDWADVVFCSGSKVELSVLLKNKPLINYGAGLLYGKGCSYEVQHPEEVNKVIAAAKAKEGYEQKQDNFIKLLGYMDSEYLYNFVRGGSHVVKQLLEKK